jgi:hypothetical protein
MERVDVTTLDQLIAAHGLPTFCKIDVEGAEADILGGLSRPIKTIAFEYVPAAMVIAREAVEELRRLGTYRFNRTVGEDHRLQHQTWLSPEEMLAELSLLERSSQSGDLYARLETA